MSALKEWHTDVLDALVASGDATKADVAYAYADAMREVNRGDYRFWGGVNRRIIERWSESGLEQIKAMAWTML